MSECENTTKHLVGGVFSTICRSTSSGPAFFSMKTILHSQLMPHTTRGRSQGLTASLSGRNFRSCLQATKTCCFSSFRGRSGRGERSDPCTYGTFFKVSRRGCLPAKKNGAPIPLRRDTWIEGWEVRTGNVKQ